MDALTGSPLPDVVARRRMFELNIGATPCSLTSDDLRELAEATEGYSGSDLSVRRPCRQGADPAGPRPRRYDVPSTSVRLTA